MYRYRDPIIIFGAVICLVEFLAMDRGAPIEHSFAVGILHLLAALVLLLTLVLYISTFRKGWSLFLRIIFAGFILAMLIYTANLSMGILLH